MKNRLFPPTIILSALNFLFFLNLTLSSACGQDAATSTETYPGKTWKRISNPEEIGWSSEKLKFARQYSQEIGSAAVMIVVHGKILDEWGETKRRFNVHSIRKSFLSALYGIYVENKRINPDDSLRLLGVDDVPPSLNDPEKQARIRDLLKSRSGVYHVACYETDSEKKKRPARNSHLPGSYFYYNNWDFNALGSIFLKTTGKSVFESFKADIADPLAMEDFRLGDTTYERCAESLHPAYVFRMSARDMARFGLLYLRNGRWRNRQIIPRNWVQESTTSYSEVGESGYGYMWWIDPGEGYSARGSGGHYLFVVPALDLVIVHRANTDVPGKEVAGRDFGQLLHLIYDAKLKNS